MTERFKVLLIITLSTILTTGLLGCATLGKGDLKQQEFRNQIQALEAQLKQKDDEIASLNAALNNQMRQKEELAKELNQAKPGLKEEIKSKPDVKQIQSALKNAGYDPGPIDGKLGRQTKEAIKAFQKANGLVVDGRLGKQTWNMLSNYLEKK